MSNWKDEDDEDDEFQVLLSKVTHLEEQVIVLENQVEELTNLIHSLMNHNTNFHD